MATNNAINTQKITTGGPVTFSGAFSSTLTFTGNTNVTFPTSGTLATVSQGVVWTPLAGTTQTAVAGNIYIINNASQTTVTLPTTFSAGSVFGVQGVGAGGFILQCAAGQIINFGSSPTSTAGSITSGNQYDGIVVIGVVANTTLCVAWSVGNLTVA